MIDIHTHILPGIDDGAVDLYDTLEMARIAAESGTTAIVATPHCRAGRYLNYYDSQYKEVFQKAVNAIRDEEIPITLYPAMEIFMTEEFPELYKEGKLIPINGSRYILVEFSFRDDDPEYANYLLRMVEAEGLVPVIAHPERYPFIQENPWVASEWKKWGYQAQCNKGSFQGRFGPEARDAACFLLDHRLIAAIASDAHRPYQRTPHMKDVYEELRMSYPGEYLDMLFTENPERFCKNLPALP